MLNINRFYFRIKLICLTLLRDDDVYDLLQYFAIVIKIVLTKRGIQTFNLSLYLILILISTSTFI